MQKVSCENLVQTEKLLEKGTGNINIKSILREFCANESQNSTITEDPNVSVSLVVSFATNKVELSNYKIRLFYA
jgi:hypothetical protein